MGTVYTMPCSSCMPRERNPITEKRGVDLIRIRQQTIAVVLQRFREGGVTFVIPEDGSGDPHFELDRPIGSEVPGLPSNLRSQLKWNLFSATSKMSCVSWSLPAGPPMLYGSCPAALSMRIIATALPSGKGKETLARGAQQVANLIARTPGRELPRVVDPEHSICSSCYAAKDGYSNASTQVAQYIRDIWTRSFFVERLPAYCRVPARARNTGEVFARAARREQWVARMTHAIVAHLGNVKKRVSMGQDPRYFRVHDSGDFFSLEYLQAWLDIAAALPHVKFWCPTRTWILPHHRHLMEQAPPNMTIRSSAIHFRDPPPVIPRLPAGTGASPSREETKAWRCPAFMADGHTCANARNPSCQHGCRVCWDEPTTPVNYAEH